MHQPTGCVRSRLKRPWDFVGFEYPIYMDKHKPYHDVYDSQGTVITSNVGSLTIDYRGLSFFSPQDYDSLGFSEFVLATDKPINGPADLRRYEVPSLDSPKEEIVLSLSRDDKLKVVECPPHQKLAVLLGIDPKWFYKVDAAWAETISEGLKPSDNFEYIDLLDEIFDQQEVEAGNQEPALDDIVDETVPTDSETSGSESGELSSPLIGAIASTRPTLSEVDTLELTPGEAVEYKPTVNAGIIPIPAVPEPKKGPDIDQLLGLVQALSVSHRAKLMDLLISHAEGTPAPDIPIIIVGEMSKELTLDLAEAKHHFSHRDPKGPDKGPDKTPAPAKRRWSFEQATRNLAAIPRTKSGRESLRVRSKSTGHDK